MFLVLMVCLLGQRLLELLLAERNRRWAVKQGGRETGQWHYPIVVTLHVCFYVSLVLEYGFVSKGWNILWPLWLSALLLAQALRIWAITSLGRSWNTRIVIIPGHESVLKGPYRYVRHPNYLAVALEFLVIPLLCGAYLTALVFSLANAFVLKLRIREEERALKQLDNADVALPRFVPKLHWRPRARKSA